jgi:AraC-like DNA-binding protein
MKKDSLMRVVSFNDKDNIPTNSFVNGYAMKLEDGSIIMQALDYMVKFNPKDFHTTKNTDIKLYPKLIRLMVNGQTIQPGMEVDGKLILDRAITRAKEFSVNYDQNTISLLFSGLNYFRPAQTYYRIRVKGFHNDWEVYSLHDGTGRVDSQGMLLYPIIGIPPGKYEIEVQASMTPDNWQVEPYVWKLSVDEPWWRMTIVYVTLGGLLLGMLITNFVFYNRITRLKLKRGNVESGIIKRVKSFSVMCESMENEQLSASLDIKDNSNTDAEDVFSEIMLKVLPYVRNHPEDLTIAQLAKEAQMDMKDFYGVMSSNLYRTPRALVLRLRLQRVAELLRNSDKTVDEIAEDLNFESANYLIASFYHQYRQTPDDYRATNPR